MTNFWKGIRYALIIEILFMALLLCAVRSWGATYYLRADGTVTQNNKANANSCASANTTMNITQHNAATYSAADTVILCSDGGVFRDATLVPPTSGVTYDASGSPVVSGADVITPGSSWTASTSNVVAEQQTNVTTEVATKGSDGNLEAQGFSSTTEITVPQIDIAIKRNGTITAGKYVWLEIWATSGSPARPAGASAIAASNGVSAPAVGTTASYVTFTFASPPTLSANTVYYMVLNADYTASDTNNIAWSVYTADNYKGDDPYRRCLVNAATPPVVQGGWNQDMAFKVYKTSGSSTIWTASVTTEPKVVLFNGTKGTHVANQASCIAEGNWFWAANVLSVYSASDPDTAYTNPGIEVGKRDQALTVWNINDLNIKNIHFTAGNDGATFGTVINYGSRNTYDNVTISNGEKNGISFINTSQDSIIKNSTVYGHECGIYTYHDGSTSGHESYVQNCNVYNNWRWGIYIRSNYWIVEHNTAHNNGSPAVTNAVNINLCDLSNEGYAQHNIVRYNIAYGAIGIGDNAVGIMADEYAAYSDIYYNISYSNEGEGFSTWKAHDINFFNNTAYNNCLNTLGGINTKGEFRFGGDAGTNDNIVAKNNIALATQPNTYAIYVDANTYGATGLNITNNLWYSAATNWYYWNDASGNNLTTWNGLTGVGTDLNADPLFTSTTDFHLQRTSPAIGAGVNVGLTTDYEGNPVPSKTTYDIGAYEYQFKTYDGTACTNTNICPNTKGTASMGATP